MRANQSDRRVYQLEDKLRQFADEIDRLGGNVNKDDLEAELAQADQTAQKQSSQEEILEKMKAMMEEMFRRNSDDVIQKQNEALSAMYLQQTPQSETADQISQLFEHQRMLQEEQMKAAKQKKDAVDDSSADGKSMASPLT